MPVNDGVGSALNMVKKGLGFCSVGWEKDAFQPLTSFSSFPSPPFLLVPVLVLVLVFLLLLGRHPHQLLVCMQMVKQFGCLLFGYLRIALEKLWRQKEQFDFRD